MAVTTYPIIAQKVVITDDALMKQVKLARQAGQPLREMSLCLREIPWRHGALHGGGSIRTRYDDTTEADGFQMYRNMFAKWECFDVFNIREAGQVLRVFGAEKDENGEYRKPALGQSIAHSRISTVVLRYKFFDIVTWLTGKIEPVSDAQKVFPNANTLLECKTTQFSAVLDSLESLSNLLINARRLLPHHLQAAQKTLEALDDFHSISKALGFPPQLSHGPQLPLPRTDSATPEQTITHALSHIRLSPDFRLSSDLHVQDWSGKIAVEREHRFVMRCIRRSASIEWSSIVLNFELAALGISAELEMSFFNFGDDYLKELATRLREHKSEHADGFTEATNNPTKSIRSDQIKSVLSVCLAVSPLALLIPRMLHSHRVPRVIYMKVMEAFGNMARPQLIEQMERLVWHTLLGIVNGQDTETLIAALIICFEGSHADPNASTVVKRDVELTEDAADIKRVRDEKAYQHCRNVILKEADKEKQYQALYSFFNSLGRSFVISDDEEWDEPRRVVQAQTETRPMGLVALAENHSSEREDHTKSQLSGQQPPTDQFPYRRMPGGRTRAMRDGQDQVQPDNKEPLDIQDSKDMDIDRVDDKSKQLLISGQQPHTGQESPVVSESPVFSEDGSQPERLKRPTSSRPSSSRTRRIKRSRIQHLNLEEQEDKGDGSEPSERDESEQSVSDTMPGLFGLTSSLDQVRAQMSGRLAHVVAWHPLTKEIADISFDTLVNLSEYDVSVSKEITNAARASFVEDAPLMSLANASSLAVDAEHPQSAVFVTNLDKFSAMSTQQIQDIFAHRHILVTGTDTHFSYSWTLETFEVLVGSLDSEVKVQDLLYRTLTDLPGQNRIATLRDVMHSKQPLPSDHWVHNGKVLNLLCHPLRLPLSETPMYLNIASHEHVLRHLDKSRDLLKREYTMGTTSWATIGSTGATSWLHTCADGLAMSSETLVGSKVWVIATPKFSNHLATIETYSDFTLERFRWKDYTVESFVLPPRATFYQRPGTYHWVLTAEPSIVYGRHFYTISTLEDSCWCLVHSLIVGGALNNASHPAMRRYVQDFLFTWHEQLLHSQKQGYKPEDGHPMEGRGVVPFPDFTREHELRTFIGVSCVAVFSRSLDPAQYYVQDEEKYPESPERIQRYRIECLNALVQLMEYYEATGHAEGMPDPFEVFTLSHQTFARAIWMYAEEQSRHCPELLQMKKILIEDLVDFWGRIQAKEFVDFSSDDLVHTDAVLDFIPADLQWVAEPKGEYAQLVNAYTSTQEFKAHHNQKQV